MKSGKITILFTIFLLISGIIRAQISLDCESGNMKIENAYCWEFNSISYSSAKSQIISGNFTVRTNSLNVESLTACWIKTPWIKAGSGNITFTTKLENGTGNTKQLILSYLTYDENSETSAKEGKPVTFYKYDYPKSGKTFSTSNHQLSIPVPPAIAGSGLSVKILISFSGTEGSNRANIDDIIIPGEYNSDPANGCIPVPSIIDKDKDGVADKEDQYPDDPNKAYNNYFPADTIPGTLAFEDSWPSKGDYDMNDLVVDYLTNRITNSSNQVVELQLKVILKASGATFKNAFALQIDNLSSENIETVKGNNINTIELFKYEPNGIESNQKFANIILFDNFYSLMKHPGKGAGINTDPDAPFVPYVTLNILIALKEPVSIKELSEESLNFYMIPDTKSGNRGKEVHLPDFIPSSLIDTKYFGMYNDNSGTPKSGGEGTNYFRTPKNLPWAIEIIQGFDYLIERTPVNNGYNYFIDWAESKGEKNKDWYKDLENYRNKDKIYPHKKQ
jgi:LruC domain-containing protein